MSFLNNPPSQKNLESSNATTLFVFLYHIIAVLKDYFRELEEESIRDNFVVTYELLDEMMDWGYPQITDQKILSEYIMQVGKPNPKSPSKKLALNPKPRKPLAKSSKTA